ncbi:MAG TPA: serine/threonine-protein kinase [Rubrobacteraceae bacterium]|nr:serine/threonine-protein kinase [Rubrobacteraceae bacterium]
MTDFTDADEILDGPPPLVDGERLVPGYEVIAHLSRGNHLDVYEAWSEERACRVVAKTPRPDCLEDRETVRALTREGRLLKKFTHPHIVRAYEVLKEPQPVVILETLTGATLEYLIDTRARRLAISEIVHLGLHLCSALHYIHRQGVLHLDLKPSNIISESQLAKIIDLSIARSPGQGEEGTGTDQYMAPEQVTGDHLSPATDVWGVGAVLWEAATGEEPFNAEDEDDEEPSYEQLERRIDPIRTYRRVPAAFASLVESCLEPDPAGRPTVDELREGLTELAQWPAR